MSLWEMWLWVNPTLKFVTLSLVLDSKLESLRVIEKVGAPRWLWGSARWRDPKESGWLLLLLDQVGIFFYRNLSRSQKVLEHFYVSKKYAKFLSWTIKSCNQSPFNATLQSLTGPVQGRIYYTGKTLFSLQGTPVLIAGTLYSSQGIMYSLQGIPCENYYTGKSL